MTMLKVTSLSELLQEIAKERSKTLGKLCVVIVIKFILMNLYPFSVFIIF